MHSFKTRLGPMPGFRVLTGSPGRPGQFFIFLNQNDVVLVKTKVNGFETGSHRVFLLLFFLQPGPIPVPGRPIGPGFKTMSLYVSPIMGLTTRIFNNNTQ